MDLILIDDDKYDEDDDESLEVEEGGALIRRKPRKEEKLYVAVGKEVRENESLLFWAIQNSGGCSLSIIHVHLPDDFIPILGKKHHQSSLDEQQVRKYRGIERHLMLKTLDEYVNICRQFGVEAEKQYIEMDSIEHGILQLINHYNIEKLVIGAAADDSYHAKMMEPKSKKAVYLLRNAPAFCHIWFICKGNLIRQREGRSHMRISSEIESLRNLNSLILKGQSDSFEASCQELPVREGASYTSPRLRVFNSLIRMGQSDSSEASSQELPVREGASYTSPRASFCMSRESTSDLLEQQMGPYSEQNHRHLSPRVVAQAKSFESLSADELRKRKQLEEDLEKVTNDRNRLREELQVARDHNLELESKVANFELVVKELEDGIISNMEMLEICEKERDDLKIERDNVLKTAEELLNQSAEAATEIVVPRFFTTLTFTDIKESTNDFNPSQQLRGGGFGSIYRGVLSCTQVTVKIWHPEGVQGPEDFHREVEILSKFRHPNIVTLIGVSPDACALVYEYLPNGSLEERLRCSDNTTPLSWKTRIGIAMGLCSALIFLHSRSPQRVVHSNLNPTSVLLDSNFTCKICDFGFSHLIPHHENSPYTESSQYPEYADPEFLRTGEVTPAADVYSFGLLVLELLTGKPAFAVLEELEEALDENEFGSQLDASAGDWPFVQAEQLATLALRCCAENASGRPDLELDVWRALEAMRASCGGSPSHHLSDEEHPQAPSYFICPIFQEVMKDPHVAADGYTYEAEALKGWLDSGHQTSPMTNLQLDHCNLVPNHALRSAIQEWRQHL